MFWFPICVLSMLFSRRILKIWDRSSDTNLISIFLQVVLCSRYCMDLLKSRASERKIVAAVGTTSAGRTECDPRFFSERVHETTEQLCPRPLLQVLLFAPLWALLIQAGRCAIAFSFCGVVAQENAYLFALGSSQFLVFGENCWSLHHFISKPYHTLGDNPHV